MIERRTLIASALAATAIAPLSGQASAMASKAKARPFKLFDCHGHFYTDDWRNYPFDAHTARYGPERMVAKAMENPMTAEKVLKFWDEAGIERGLGVQYSSTYFTDNSYLLDIAEKYDRIIPIVILDATAADETPATLKKMASENGIAGVRFMGVPNENNEFPFLTDAASASWEMANELGLTITLMPITRTDPGKAIRRVGELADKYPNVGVVLDHIGFPRYGARPDSWGYLPEHLELAAHKNIHYKYTTFLIEMLLADDTPLKEFLEYTVGVYGADHMIWGSDIGNSEVDDLLFVQHALDSASGLSMEQQKALFYDTAKSLFIPGGRGAA
ncbi:amidohydrolase family protein [Hyphococcus sp.]|uniref:amidohydrolase family protein n=1 Tax=Hyphococcus sp. TaxID=2038636 RepID=UPI0035C769A2